MDQGTSAPRLRRAYFECRHGQLHVHNAIPSGGGFDELTTLLCLHGDSTTGRVFLEFSRLLGASRSVYSPDIPGRGESDAPPQALSMPERAEAIADFVDSMRFRQIDLLGIHEGSGVAVELALARPKVVRRIVMIGTPVSGWAAESRLALLKNPLLMLRPGGADFEASGRAARAVPSAKVVELAQLDGRLLETHAAVAAGHVTAFLA